MLHNILNMVLAGYGLALALGSHDHVIVFIGLICWVTNVTAIVLRSQP